LRYPSRVQNLQVRSRPDRTGNRQILSWCVPQPNPSPMIVTSMNNRLEGSLNVRGVSLDETAYCAQIHRVICGQ
jgi:hypothetical protein